MRSKHLIFRTFLIVLLTFSQQSYATFHVRFLGGTAQENKDSGKYIQQGSLFKGLVSNGTNVRFSGSFTYSQSTFSTFTIQQGEIGLGIMYYPHYTEPVPSIQPFFHLEGVGLFTIKEDTSSLYPKNQDIGVTANIGVGMDINFSRSLGLVVGAEIHNFKQHRVLIGFLQGY